MVVTCMLELKDVKATCERATELDGFVGQQSLWEVLSPCLQGVERIKLQFLFKDNGKAETFFHWTHRK